MTSDLVLPSHSGICQDAPFSKFSLLLHHLAVVEGMEVTDVDSPCTTDVNSPCTAEENFRNKRTAALI